ncbi:DUF3304 domain-containing protein [Pseudomonas lundensis]|uniref:DUF3304 domain-containing protein n=1 Tax=Pseudomonas lundensis TaxID=86185 RepID=UPI000653CFAB|nr:DUF3304 domain-containing protein [Pseudomonas lundensis]KMM93757.1 hypothetical protein TU74_06435 [Pseudomonas lundensis]
MSRVLIRVLWLMLISGLSLQGCTPPKLVRLGTPIEGYSHTSAAIRFSVNGGGGPNLAPYGYGGGQNCCASLPVKWHPGLTVVVEWEKDPDPYAYGRWPERVFSDAWSERMKEHKTRYTRHRAVVPVAPYERLGAIDVHFLPCNQVAVSAVAMLPGQPGYPFNFPQKMQEPATCPES